MFNNRLLKQEIMLRLFTIGQKSLTLSQAAATSHIMVENCMKLQKVKLIIFYHNNNKLCLPSIVIFIFITFETECVKFSHHLRCGRHKLSNIKTFSQCDGKIPSTTNGMCYL